MQSNKAGAAVEFPTEVFPLSVSCLIEQARQALGFYPEHVGSAALFAASVAVGNTLRLRIKNGWSEYSTLFMSLVGNPGSTKSHALSLAVQPFDEPERRFLNEYLMEKAEFEASKNEHAQRPALKQYLISDATTEAVCAAMAHNTRGLGLCRDEQAAWVKDLNKYRSGSDTEFWLSLWSGKPVKVNRKSSDVVIIFEPKVDVIGTIQPGILSALAKDDKDKNGFLDRILFAYPAHSTPHGWTDDELSPAVTDAYKAIIMKLLTINGMMHNGKLFPREVRYSADAKQVFTRWYNSNAELKADEAIPERLRNCYSKHDIYVNRLALLLQTLHWADDAEPHTTQYDHIGVKAITGAIRLIEYYRSTYERVYEGLLGEKAPSVAALKERIKELRGKEYSYREIADLVGLSKTSVQKYYKN